MHYTCKIHYFAFYVSIDKTMNILGRKLLFVFIVIDTNELWNVTVLVTD